MKHTLSVLVENESGVLTRIAGLFARRGFNIESLSVGPAEQKNISRITEETRTEIMDIAKVFNARIVDLASKCLTIEVTGEPEKILALEQLLQKFGILEIAKTGKIALLRHNTQTSTIQYIG